MFVKRRCEYVCSVEYDLREEENFMCVYVCGGWVGGQGVELPSVTFV